MEDAKIGGMTPAHVDLQRQVGGGATVHLAADHTAGVLHRNTTLGKLDVDDKDHDDQQGADDRGELAPNCHRCRWCPQPISHSCGQEAGADGHEDKDGHTLAEALSVTNSAIHMIRPVPPVMMSTMTTRFHTEPSGTT